MKDPRKTLSIHPYFRVKPGKMEQARKLLPRFVAAATKEPGNHYYDFTINGDTIFCREAYVGAQGLLDHIAGVGPILAEFLQLVDILRVEVHGAPEELDLLRGPLADMKPEWFVFECGVKR